MELLVTMSVATILLTLGVPAFQDLIKNNRLTTAANELVGALSLARSEAIKRGVRVTVCKSSTGAACANSGGWDQGWIVFTDPNNNAIFDSGDALLRVREAVQSNLSITGNTNLSDYTSYVARGHSQLTSGAFQAGTIKACDDRTGNVGKSLVVSQSGRIRVETGASCT